MLSLHAAPSALAAALVLASGALAHMQLTWPPPLHSKYSAITPEPLIDYSMTSPLVTDGIFPCKGFINNPASLMVPVTTWSAGSTVNYTVTGTATHGGGSCQVALSYDEGKTWSTIYSHVGGCLIEGLTESITVPKEAQSGDVLFAWNWFNQLGNREMYENCAVVTITDGGSGLSDASAFPPPFVANADVNDCHTIEGIDVVFPYPGRSVKYGGKYASSQPTTPAGFTGSNCVPPGQTNGVSYVALTGLPVTSSTSAVSVAPSSSSVAPTTSSIAPTSSSVAPSSSSVVPAVAATSAGSASSLNPSSYPASSSTTSLSASTSASTASASASTATDKVKTCRPKKRALSPSEVRAIKDRQERKRILSHNDFSGLERRHERLVRRRVGTGRVAALKAEKPT